MNVNGVTKVNDAYQPYQKPDTVSTNQETATVNAGTDADKGVVYEHKLEMPTKTYKANAEMVNKLKADAQARIDQLQTLVSQLISKQAGTFADANDMWSMLREGKLNVDPATKAQAEKDISEDGYWGVKQTSDRILDFAVALTGGDPSKLKDMAEAFKKGYKQAEKTWGGELPEISKKTYDEVLRKFDEMIAENEAQ